MSGDCKLGSNCRCVSEPQLCQNWVETMKEYPHVPAAFINAIAEEGTKEEAIEWLQKEWNTSCAYLAALKKIIAMEKQGVFEQCLHCAIKIAKEVVE